MSIIVNDILTLEDNLEMGLLSQDETRDEIGELFCQILRQYPEGSKKSEVLQNQLTEVQNLAFDIYDIEAWY